MTLLLIVANGMPVIARNLLEPRFNLPVDFHIKLTDNHPLFGKSKTWRGLLSSILGTGIFAYLLHLGVYFGALFGLLVMLGDLLASFCKRRLGYIESSRFRALDIIPESSLPFLFLNQYTNTTLLESTLCVLIFFLIEVYLSPLLYRLHIRKRPY